MSILRVINDLISDDEIKEVHGNANFGCMSPRAVVNESILKTALGYCLGSTALAILREHKLVTKPNKMHRVFLTKKGQKYLRIMFANVTTEEILKFIGCDYV